MSLTYRVKPHFISVLGERLLLVQESPDGAVSSLSDGKSLNLYSEKHLTSNQTYLYALPLA